MELSKEDKKELNRQIIERINYELFDRFDPRILNRNKSEDWRIAAAVGCSTQYVTKLRQLL